LYVRWLIIKKVCSEKKNPSRMLKKKSFIKAAESLMKALSEEKAQWTLSSGASLAFFGEGQ